MWDRERRLSELLDDKARTFFMKAGREMNLPAWSLWDTRDLILGNEEHETRHRDETLSTRIPDWVQLAEDGKAPDRIQTADGLCLLFFIRHDLEVAGLLVFGPMDADEISPHVCSAGRVMAGLIELLVWTNLKQALMTDMHKEAMATSYDELVQRNRALEESEKKYRELAENLEVRVASKTAELKRAYSRLLHAEKMASIGQLAAGVAHEINNPLAFVKSNLRSNFETVKDLFEMVRACMVLLQRQPDDAQSCAKALRKIFARYPLESLKEDMEDFKDLVEETFQGVERVQKIVSDLREFSHIDNAEVSELDIHKALETTISVLAHELGDNIEIIRRYGEHIPFIICQPREITQVFMNVLLNAIQSIEGSGRIIITTSLADGAREKVRISIADTGIGIPPDNLSRIFDPFFTTKPVGQGTGTGLSVCYEAVKAHGGTIEASSKVGRGTVVTIILPVEGVGAGALSHV